MLLSVVSRSLRRTAVASLIMTTAMGYSFAAGEGLSQAAMDKLVNADQILSGLSDEAGKKRVIVEFAMPDVPDAAEAGDAEAADVAQTSAVHQKQDEILGRVFSAEGGLSATLSSEELAVTRMDFSPMFAIDVDEATLAELASDPAVVRIHEDALSEPSLIQSLPLIGMPAAYAGGATGSGWYVAVLDTGARRTHEFLSSSVYSAACYNTASSSYPSYSLCPGGASSSTSISSAPDCNEATIGGCGHGTHVSGTAAGYNTSLSSGEPTSGVARSARLITINVFSRFTGSTNCGSSLKSSGCVLSFTSDQIRGLERVYALRNTYNIASINMSLGGGQFFSACDTDSRKPIIDSLRSAGIATVIAAGNSGFNTSVGAPGCISSAITVASSTKSDARSSFSNWGTLVDVVAPGSSIYASYPNGSSNNYYTYLSGTSMASPHVAGAFAALRSARPAATVSQIEAALESTGLGIASAGTTKPRIRVANALNVLGSPAVMTSPSNGSVIGSSVTLQWSTGSGVSSYWLHIGTTGVGSSNLYNASNGTSRTKTISGLPTGTIYVRLWSYIYGNWASRDYVYYRGVKAAMTSPTPGSALSGSATFQWSTGTAVAEYYLYVGSTGVGSTNIYAASQGTGRTRTVSGLPSSGTIYVRLWSRIGSTWQWTDYTYATGTPAVMTSPTPGSALASSATFQWSTGSNVNEYYLYVGSTGVGSSNVYAASNGTSRTRTVSGLPSSGTIYVRLWSRIGTGWQWKDYTYVAGSPAVMTSPTPGSTLGSSATFQWSTGSNVSEYYLYVGSSGVGSSNIYAASNGTSRIRTVSGLPSSGTIYVRLWSRIGSNWQSRDYTYLAGGGAKAVMITPKQGWTIGSPTTFHWSPGTNVTQYWLSVGTSVGSGNIYYASNGTSTSRAVTGIPTSGTVYVRLWSLISGSWQSNDYTYTGTARAVMTAPLQGSSIGSSMTFYWSNGTNVSQYWMYVGTTGAGSFNIYQASQGTATSKTVTGIPTSGTVYVRLWSLIGSSWQYVDYSYTGTPRAVMYWPEPGVALASSANFYWRPGTGATQYYLYVGSTGEGSYNIYNASTGTSTAKTVTGLPSTGTVYVRLWSLISGSWQYIDYTYGAGAATAVMTSPTPGSTLSSSSTFKWTAGNGAWQYYLYVGTTGAGSYNIVNQNTGTATSRTVSGLPSTGTVYVRLWSYLSSGWYYNDYSYNAGADAASAGSAVQKVSLD